MQIDVRDSLAEITAEQWNALCDDGNPFLRHEFLHTLDITGCLGEATGWYPRYFLLWQGESKNRELIGAVPAYVKTNSYGEFVFDWAWAEAFERHQLDYYPKLVSSIPFTPATGRRVLVRADQPFADTVKLLATALRQFAATQDYSSVHYLFVTEAESDVLSARLPKEADQSVSQGTHADNDHGDESNAVSGSEHSGATENDLIGLETATDHLRRIDCQYHWRNDNYSDFDDFLARCTSKRRKTIRRERRHVSDAGIRLEQRLGSTLTDQEWLWVHQFYSSTFDRKWGSPSLTHEFFRQIGEKLGDKVLIVFAYDSQDTEPEWPIACSIMFIGTKTLYGRFWGCRKQYNSLHFEACYYQGISYCIDHGIKNFEPGAQGEHKITRGFEPTITRSAHYIRHPGFRDAIANYLAQETPYVQQRCTGLTDLLPFKSDTLSL
ncbi:MAG: GNAT family N-acetyltransferase [Granulosicoccus sp.]